MTIKASAAPGAPLLTSRDRQLSEKCLPVEHLTSAASGLRPRERMRRAGA